jgi:putative flippase GtrA
LSYLLFGGLGAASDFVAFALLTTAGLAPVPANVLSVALGIGVSYTFNSRITFGTSVRRGSTILKFYVVGVSGLVFSSILLWLLVDELHLTPIPAKLITMPIVAGSQFLANRFWTFQELHPES